MKIAIVSDSHGAIDRLEIMCQNLQKAGITHIFHIGDFLVYGIKEIFQKFPDIKFTIARGNCDVNEELLDEISDLSNVYVKEIVNKEFEGVKFGMSHKEGIAENVLKNEKINVFCHGHTHIPKAVKKDNILILNPGALCEDGRYFILNLPKLKLEQKLYNQEL